MEEKKNLRKMSDEDLENINGGYGSGEGYCMHVGNCNGSYLGLRTQPCWDQNNELTWLWPGYEVFTYGQMTNGTGLNGKPCTYTYVNYNGIWGWADSSFLY